jgi:hypothetical protein
VRCRGAAVALLTLSIALAGCSTYAASRDVASADTGQALRAYRGTRTVAVGPFVATVPNQREMKCREKGHFTTPDGETFEEFVRQAPMNIPGEESVTVQVWSWGAVARGSASQWNEATEVNQLRAVTELSPELSLSGPDSGVVSSTAVSLLPTARRSLSATIALASPADRLSSLRLLPRPPLDRAQSRLGSYRPVALSYRSTAVLPLTNVPTFFDNPGPLSVGGKRERYGDDDERSRYASGSPANSGEILPAVRATRSATILERLSLAGERSITTDSAATRGDGEHDGQSWSDCPYCAEFRRLHRVGKQVWCRPVGKTGPRREGGSL